MKKHIKTLSVFLGLLILLLCLSACFNDGGVGITSIEKTSSEGLTDIYTITYSDGSTTTFAIQNGADGEDGENGIDGEDGTDGIDGEDGVSLTVEDLYGAYVEAYGAISYEEFLEKFLTTDKEDTEVVHSALRSSARVYAEFSVRSFVTTTPSVSVGSAVIYSMDDEYTYFITNYHVIYNEDAIEPIAPKIHCYLYGSDGAPTVSGSGSYTSYTYEGSAIACTYVGGSQTYDIAVFKAKTEDIIENNPDAAAVEFADDYTVGQTAIAIGNPDDGGISVTRGIVSVEDEYINLEIAGTVQQYRSIRIDTPLYSGNSGGGLFNTEGKLIGITNAGTSDEQNINFAIPVSIVKGAVENILYHEKDGNESTNGVGKITVGITVMGENAHYVYDSATGHGKTVEDVRITEVLSDSLAASLGLSVNDCILAFSVDGTTVTVNQFFDIADILLVCLPDTTISITYQRDGVSQTTATYRISADDINAVK